MGPARSSSAAWRVNIPPSMNTPTRLKRPSRPTKKNWASAAHRYLALGGAREGVNFLEHGDIFLGCCPGRLTSKVREDVEKAAVVSCFWESVELVQNGSHELVDHVVLGWAAEEKFLGQRSQLPRGNLALVLGKYRGDHVIAPLREIVVGRSVSKNNGKHCLWKGQSVWVLRALLLIQVDRLLGPSDIASPAKGRLRFGDPPEKIPVPKGTVGVLMKPKIGPWL